MEKEKIFTIFHKEYENKKFLFPVSPCCEEDLRGGEVKKIFYVGCPKCKRMWQLRKSDGWFYEVKTKNTPK